MQSRRRFKSRRAGLSLVEVLTAALVGTMTLVAAVAIFLSGLMSWARGQSRMDAETQSRQAVRVISNQLQEAMGIVIDADGMGLSYTMPKKDASGNFISPPTWDGVTRRLYYTNGEMRMSAGATVRTFGRNIITTDPTMSNASYKIFTASTGNVLIRQVNVKVVTRVTGGKQPPSVGKKREQVYLRNVPQLEYN